MHQVDQIKKLQGTMTNSGIVMAIESIKSVFEFFYECVEFDSIDKPMTKEQMTDPDNKSVQLILYLYTMEPSLYFDVNQACMNVDHSKLSKQSK